MKALKTIVVELFNDLPQIIYTTSQIVTLLHVRYRTVRQFRREWKRGRIYQGMFELLGLDKAIDEINCENCDPYQRMKPYGRCQYSKKENKLVIWAIKHDTSGEFVVLEAQASTLNKTGPNNYCVLEYSGTMLKK